MASTRVNVSSRKLKLLPLESSETVAPIFSAYRMQPGYLLDMTDGGFYWTAEELQDAARVAMERLHHDSTELDEFLPRSAHVDRIRARTQAERTKRAKQKAEQRLAAYEAGNGAASA